MLWGDTSLPVGILGGVNGQSRVVHLTVGDYAVLVSDGLLVDGPGWVAKQLELSAAAGEAPEKVAKTLVETARVRAQKSRQAGRHYGGGAAAGKMRLMFIQTSLIFRRRRRYTMEA